MSTMPIYALVDTWNSAGTTFTGIGLNVTDTASAAGSLLMDLQVGAVSQFKVGKGGVVSVGSTLELGHASDTTLARASAGVVTIEGNTVYTSGNLPGTAITWTAQQTFAAAPIIAGAFSSLLFNDTGAAVDNRKWRFVTTTTQLYLQTQTDDELTSGNPLILTRTGTAVTEIELNATTLDFNGTVDVSTHNIATDTTTGTKIGTATNQKLAFFNATPVVQPTAVADATDAASVITQLNALLTRMRNLGLIAT